MSHELRTGRELLDSPGTSASRLTRAECLTLGVAYLTIQYIFTSFIRDTFLNRTCHFTTAQLRRILVLVIISRLVYIYSK